MRMDRHSNSSQEHLFHDEIERKARRERRLESSKMILRHRGDKIGSIDSQIRNDSVNRSVCHDFRNQSGRGRLFVR